MAPLSASGEMLAYDGFENGWTGGTGFWAGAWSHSTDGVVINESPYAGTYHARVHNDGGYIQRIVDLSTSSAVHLTYAYKTRSLNAGDYGYVDIYDGVWHSHVRTYAQNDNVYRVEDIDLSAYNMVSNFQIKFGISCAGGRHYFYMDEVTFAGTAGTPTPDPTPSPTPVPTETPTPAPDNAILVEAEDYTSFYDTTAGNSGGMYRTDDVDIEVCHDGTSYSSYDIAWMAANEWLGYGILVVTPGAYTCYTRVASLSVNGSYHLEVDGVNVTGTLTFPATGGWQAWADSVKTGITLTAGAHTLKFVAHANDFNLDFFYFASEVNPPAPSPLPQRNWGPVPTEPPGYANTVALNGRLQVAGSRVLNQFGNPIQLRGWSSHGLQYYPYIAEHTVRNLAYDRMVNITRAAMYVEEGGYLGNPVAMKAKVNEMVTDAIATGIYVIIDWHIHANPADFTSEASAFFQEMSAQWGTYPNIIWEICNEPIGGAGGVNWTTIKSYADSVIPVIRANDPDNLVVVGTPTWCQEPGAAIAAPIQDPNVAYSFHFYSGTHGDTQLASADLALDAGLPVFCTEWGTSDYAETANDFTAATAYLGFMESRSMNWAHWSFSIKNEASAALVVSASPAGPWDDIDFTLSGTFVKEAVTAQILPDAYSASIAMTGFGPVAGKYYAQAVITIKDSSGAVVPNAKIAGKWSGATTDSDSGLTGADGRLTVTSDKIRTGGTFTFTVLNVVPSGKRWHPNFAGSVNTNSITYP